MDAPMDAYRELARIEPESVPPARAWERLPVIAVIRKDPLLAATAVDPAMRTPAAHAKRAATSHAADAEAPSSSGAKRAPPVAAKGKRSAHLAEAGADAPDKVYLL